MSNNKRINTHRTRQSSLISGDLPDFQQNDTYSADQETSSSAINISKPTLITGLSNYNGYNFANNFINSPVDFKPASSPLNMSFEESSVAESANSSTEVSTPITLLNRKLSQIRKSSPLKLVNQNQGQNSQRQPSLLTQNTMAQAIESQNNFYVGAYRTEPNSFEDTEDNQVSLEENFSLGPTLLERDFPAEILPFEILDKKDGDYIIASHKLNRVSNANNYGSLLDAEFETYEELIQSNPRMLRVRTEKKLDNLLDTNKSQQTETTQRRHRTYSESETANFSDKTGARLYDDDKHRPIYSLHQKHEPLQDDSIHSTRNNSQLQLDQPGTLIPSLPGGMIVPDANYRPKFKQKKSYNKQFGLAKTHQIATSTLELMDPGASIRRGMLLHPGVEIYKHYQSLLGCEDEYVPGLVFNEWDVSDGENETEIEKVEKVDRPAPIKKADVIAHKPAATKDLEKVDKAPVPPKEESADQVEKVEKAEKVEKIEKAVDVEKADEKAKKAEKPVKVSEMTTDTPKNDSNVIDYNQIIASLPDNFLSLLYSERRKILLKLLPNHKVDTKVLLSLIKKRFTKPQKTANQFLVAKKQNIDDRGSIVMNHELGKIIGYGSWGIVRECTDLNTKEVRAIKIVKTKNEVVRRCFKKEIRIWKLLDNKRLLPLLFVKETSYAIFCITPRIYGGTLFDIVSNWGVYNDPNSPVSMDKRHTLIHKYIWEILDGLSYMHYNGVVHGDLKLENCLIDEVETPNGKREYHILICDFGMSCFYMNPERSRTSNLPAARSSFTKLNSLQDKPQIPRSPSSENLSVSLKKMHSIVFDKNITHDDTPVGISTNPDNMLQRSIGPAPTSLSLNLGPIVFRYIQNDQPSTDKTPLPHTHIGSLPYAAPEILLPNPPPLGPMADIWAFGVLTYTMIVGKLPFQHEFEPRLRAMISKGKFDEMSLREACFGDERLQNVVCGCLSAIGSRWDIGKLVVQLQSKRNVQTL